MTKLSTIFNILVLYSGCPMSPKSTRMLGTKVARAYRKKYGGKRKPKKMTIHVGNRKYKVNHYPPEEHDLIFETI